MTKSEYLKENKELIKDLILSYEKDIDNDKLLELYNVIIELAKENKYVFTKVDIINFLKSLDKNMPDELEVDQDILSYYKNVICAMPLLSVELEKDLFIRYKNGEEELKDKIFLSNTRLVYSIAKNYNSNYMDLMDLIEEGNIGLLIAIDHYDPSLNFRFSTYATWWIKQAVTRALETKSKPIRLPSKVYQLSLKIPKLKADFYMKNNREMTNLELANSLDISLEKLEVLLNAYNEPISLQNKFRSDDNDEEIIILVEDKETNVEEEALENINYHKLYDLIDESLNDREKYILIKRYGLCGLNEPGKLKDIANDLNISHQRVKEIEQNSLKKLLRASKVSKIVY